MHTPKIHFPPAEMLGLELLHHPVISMLEELFIQKNTRYGHQVVAHGSILLL